MPESRARVRSTSSCPAVTAMISPRVSRVAEARGGLESVKSRHVAIHQYDVKPFDFALAQRGLPRTNNGRFRAMRGECPFQHHAIDLVVVHN